MKELRSIWLDHTCTEDHDVHVLGPFNAEEVCVRTSIDAPPEVEWVVHLSRTNDVHHYRLEMVKTQPLPVPQLWKALGGDDSVLIEQIIAEPKPRP